MIWETVIGFFAKWAFKSLPALVLSAAVTSYGVNTYHKVVNVWVHKRIAAENFQAGYEKGLARCRGDIPDRKWWQIFRGEEKPPVTEAEFHAELDEDKPRFAWLLDFAYPIDAE